MPATARRREQVTPVPLREAPMASILTPKPMEPAARVLRDELRELVVQHGSTEFASSTRMVESSANDGPVGPAVPVSFEESCVQTQICSEIMSPDGSSDVDSATDDGKLTSGHDTHPTVDGASTALSEGTDMLDDDDDFDEAAWLALEAELVTATADRQAELLPSATGPAVPSCPARAPPLSTSSIAAAERVPMVSVPTVWCGPVFASVGGPFPQMVQPYMLCCAHVAASPQPPFYGDDPNRVGAPTSMGGWSACQRCGGSGRDARGHGPSSDAVAVGGGHRHRHREFCGLCRGYGRA